MKRVFYLTVAAAIAAVAAFFGLAGGDDTIRVGSKKFTESYIMSEMVSALLTARGYAVEEKFDMGSGVVRQALEHGQVDIYWEYTGTAYVMHHKQNDPAIMTDRRKVYQSVKATDAKMDLIWLNPASFNNTYTLMMTHEKSEALGIDSISQLATYVRAHPDDVALASNAEWFARPDGFRGLAAHYGFQFPPEKVIKMESGLIYRALRDEVIDVAMGYSTDARIVALNLVNLADDKGFFPVYNPVPVVRGEVLRKFPELADMLNDLAERLDDATITELNYRVDIDKQSAQDVAQSWLRKQNLL